jgi:hypothetical protein
MTMHPEAREKFIELVMLFIGRGMISVDAVSLAKSTVIDMSHVLYEDDERRRREARNFEFDNPTPD